MDFFKDTIQGIDGSGATANVTGDSTLRQRTVNEPKPEKADAGLTPVPATKALTPTQLAKQEDNAFSWVDVLRGLTFLVLFSSLVSYFVTKESFTWNLERPNFTRVDVIKSWIVQLPSFSGSNRDKLTSYHRLAHSNSQMKIWSSLMVVMRPSQSTLPSTVRSTTFPLAADTMDLEAPITSSQVPMPRVAL